MKEHSASEPVTALERSRKLKSLQVTKGKLIGLVCRYKTEIKEATENLVETKRNIKLIDKSLKALKEDDTVVVTEHALLRYVERVMHIDLEQVHAEVVAMAEEDLIRAGNTIVTVIPDKNDHFNLAERESQ